MGTALTAILEDLDYAPRASLEWSLEAAIATHARSNAKHEKIFIIVYFSSG